MSAIYAPSKMVEPHLPTWVEERYDLSRFGISSLDLVRFVPVASQARPSHIVHGGLAASGSRNDVFDRERSHGIKFWAAAVLASGSRTHHERSKIDNSQAAFTRAKYSLS